MAIGADGIRPGPVTAAEPVAGLAALGDARQEVFHRSLQQMLGQQLQGNVLSRLTDGTFMVKVEGMAARMQLPEGTKAGDTLPMTLTSLTPRPTFALGQEHGGAPVVILQDGGAEEGSGARTASSAAQAARNAAAGILPAPGKPLVYLEPGTQALFSGDAGSKAAALATAGKLINVFSNDEPLIYSPPRPNSGAAAALPGANAGTTAGTAAGSGTAGTSGTPAAAALLSKSMLLNNASPYAAIADDGSSAPALFSSAGRMITQVLQAAQKSDAPNAIIGRTPIVPTPALLPEQVAAALHDTIGLSGVFYESHLREWVDGKRTLTELAREPQGQAQQPGAAASRAAAAAAALPLANEKALSGLPLTADGLAAAVQAGAATTATAAAAPVDVAFTQLVNLQLNALEKHSVQWSGQIWPGQQMDWEVKQEPPKQGGGQSGDQAEGRIWQSSMRFHFPLLGKVGATIHLVGDVVHVEVSAADPETAATLREAQAALSDALGAAGSPLQSFSVKSDEAA